MRTVIDEEITLLAAGIKKALTKITGSKERSTHRRKEVGKLDGRLVV